MTCLSCTDRSVVISQIAAVCKDLKHKSNERMLQGVGAAIATASAFLATGGLSELLSGGLGTTSSAYLGIRLAHIRFMLSRLKTFRDRISDGCVLDGCRCSTAPGDMRENGKCDLTFRERPDDNIGN